MSTSDSQAEISPSPSSLNQLIKRIVLAFCEVNVPFASRLDIYGSLHVRADDQDTTFFILNEHCYRRTTHNGAANGAILTRHTSSIRGDEGVHKMEIRDEVCDTAENDAASCVAALSSAVPVASCRAGNQQHSVKSDNIQSISRQNSSTATERENVSSAVVSNVVADLSSENGSLMTAEDTKQGDASLALHHRHPDAVDEYADDDDEVDGERCNEVNDDDDMSDEESVELVNDTGRPTKDTNEFIPSCVAYAAGDKVMQAIKIEDSSEELLEGELENDASGTSSQLLLGSFPNSFSSSANYYNQAEAYVAHAAAWLKSESNSSMLPKRILTDNMCRFCRQCFESRSQLRAHIQQVHTRTNTADNASSPRTRNSSHMYGSGPFGDIEAERFSCPICGLLFRSLDGLRCHENSKHSRNKLYQCRFCSEAFLTRQASYTHRIKFHRLEPKKVQ